MKQLYRQPNPDPREVASRITSALDEATRRDLSGPGVACCLSSLLQASRQVAEAGLAALVSATDRPPLLAASEAIRERAERAIARGGFASRFSDLGLNALATAVFEAGAGGSAELFHVDADRAAAALGSYCTDQRLHCLALTFVGHDFDHLYRYFVTRDTSDFVGGPGLPTVAEASQLRDAVSRYCRETAACVEAAAHEAALAAALRLDDDGAVAHVQDVLTDLTERGLQRLAAAG
ncbi:MAG: hypothetical protein KKI08_04265 [Armatimonadetes bacterium]|nr:hypothetical protein [Armatimonadota bacterium]